MTDVPWLHGKQNPAYRPTAFFNEEPIMKNEEWTRGDGRKRKQVEEKEGGDFFIHHS